MEEAMENVGGNDFSDKEEVYTQVVKAGKRTYFVDAKATKRNELYITITESKKRFNTDGRYYYEKHKIFLYREDFEKFMDGLNDVLGFVKRTNPSIEAYTGREDNLEEDTYSQVDFDQLSK